MKDLSIFKDDQVVESESTFPCIVVIDDDPGVRDALKLRFEKDYRIISCANGKEGLRVIDEQVFSVILDIKMEGMDGFETLLEIKKKFPNLPVIFYSAYQDLKSPFEIMNQYRPFGYVIKEGSITELSDTLRSAVNYSRQIFKNQKLIYQLQDSLKKEHEALQHLRQADKMKDEFLANTSHELRTPLNAMIGLAEGLLATGHSSRIMQQDIELIVSSGKRLTHLIDDILDFSRLKHRDLELNFTSVSIHDILAMVLPTMQPLVQNKPVTLHNDADLSAPPVKADSDRLQQIFYNLIGNAIKFTPSGKVTIKTLHWESKLQIEISDTGIGIDSSQLSKIFKPFEQVKRSSQPQAGIGLGLAITKQLVELHQGGIHIQSTPGKGTSVNFTLPISTEPPSHIQIYQQIKPLTPSESEFSMIYSSLGGEHETEFHILIVDDDPINLKVVSNHLTAQGHQLTWATNGKEALEIINDEPSLDLVILDVMMPLMDGYETCHKIRERYSQSELPIILLTAKNQMADLVKGLQAGANDYLVKPFYREELLARVETQLQLKKTVDHIKENKRLQKEIHQREKIEQQLISQQRRLLRLLDIAESAIIVSNQHEVITYLNQSAESFLDYKIHELCNQPISMIFPDWKTSNLTAFFSHINGSNSPNHNQFVQVNILCKPDRPIPVHVTLTCLNLLEEKSYVISFLPSSPTLPLRPALQEWLTVAGEGLSQVFTKGDPGFIRETRSVAHSLDGVSLSTTQQTDTDKIRFTLVDVVNKSLTCWQYGTGKGKVELAEESQVWSVYLEKSGSFTTRTFDKYFSLSTLPKRPHWRHVLTTAFFVLEATEASNPHYLPLKAAVEELQQLMQKQTLN